jgi:hypothetical protein
MFRSHILADLVVAIFVGKTIFRNVVFSIYTELWKMDEVHKPSDSENFVCSHILTNFVVAIFVGKTFHHGFLAQQATSEADIEKKLIKHSRYKKITIERIK